LATCLIIGGGPAGLTAAWTLAKAGAKPIVFEAERIVGGISRTDEYKGYRFDIGGHRFFTKVKSVEKFWMDILGSEFLVRPRLSRIYYDDKFFDYPLKPVNALLGLGPVESVRIGLSYLSAQLFPSREEVNLEQWVANRFGRRLYEIFFKTYTEKVWGMKCTEIGADWAAQRIKNLDLKEAVKNAFLGSGQKKITTLIEQFHYPRFGPGQMWEKVASLLAEAGHAVRMGSEVVKVHHDGGRITGVTSKDRSGKEERVEGDYVISSMPIRNLLNAFDPAPPAEVLRAANELRYRDFLTVGLIVDHPDLFPDNWIYIHSSKVKVGRIQNFKNWSPHMVPEASKSSIGLEYFVQENDEIWSAKDEDLVALGAKECAILGLADEKKVVDGCVIRMPKAYPVYDRAYKEALAVIRGYVDPIPNLDLVGRNGQHRYNNQDHSMVTAMLAAENALGAAHDVWDVNVEQEYHEEIKEGEAKAASGDRAVPETVELDPLVVLQEAFARYDPIALGISLAVVFGVGLFYSTAVLVIKGGEVVGPHLSRVGNYLIGFEVTWSGAIVGFFEAGAVGFVVGFAMAHAINLVVALHERALLQRLETLQTLEGLEQASPPT
jgi:protoporphyrinogen oxidase